MDWVKFFDILYSLLTRREKDSLRAIRREYEQTIKDLIGELGNIYNRIEGDGTLSFTDIKTFREIKRFQQRATAQANRLGKFNRETIDKLLDDSHGLSYSWMSFGVEKAVDITLKDATPSLPELVAFNRANMLEKIRLDRSLERSRAKITIGIQDAIENGLRQGHDFKLMAADIQKVFDMDYNRALVIAETEVHRVREIASRDSALNASRQGVEMEKVWSNVGDERVRKTSKANHRDVHGQRKALNDPFILKDGVTAQMPGSSGTPYNDIRCRCYARYEVVGIKTIGVAEGRDALVNDFKQWQQGKTS